MIRPIAFGMLTAAVLSAEAPAKNFSCGDIVGVWKNPRTGDRLSFGKHGEVAGTSHLDGPGRITTENEVGTNLSVQFNRGSCLYVAILAGKRLYLSNRLADRLAKCPSGLFDRSY